MVKKTVKIHKNFCNKRFIVFIKIKNYCIIKQKKMQSLFPNQLLLFGIQFKK